jgi:hypothetical protein
MANPTGRNQYTGKGMLGKTPASRRHQYEKAPGTFTTIFKNERSFGASRKKALVTATTQTRLLVARKLG